MKVSQEAARKAEREAGQSRVEKEWLITQQKAAGRLIHDTYHSHICHGPQVGIHNNLAFLNSSN